MVALWTSQIGTVVSLNAYEIVENAGKFTNATLYAHTGMHAMGCAQTSV